MFKRFQYHHNEDTRRRRKKTAKILAGYSFYCTIINIHLYAHVISDIHQYKQDQCTGMGLEITSRMYSILSNL